MIEKIKQDDDQPNSINYTDDSADILISKNLLPPALVLLPRIQNNPANSLLPMLPLPNFIGLIPIHQPLENIIKKNVTEVYPNYQWIGSAFTNVIYKKYFQASYQKIDNFQESWNMWACDIGKLLSEKVEQKNINTEIKPYYILKDQNDKTLIFQSRFQSGNLSMASKISDNQYNLLLQNDINTTGYSQWFFFKVSNTIKNSKVKFNILNLHKQNTLYKSGMKVVVYSTKESEQKNISWHRAGQNIQYYENGYSKSTVFVKPLFTLSWVYNFLYDKDQVYFAYNYPYTYTNLDRTLQKYQTDLYSRQIMKRSLLCKTLAGNRVDVITITEQCTDQINEKAYIIISARVHPGETVSSFVLNGIMKFLLSNNEKAKKLRENFIFKIVPMVNPDGVIHGNYRTNLSGHDLNRKWQNPSKSFNPEIFNFKRMIINCHQQSQVLLFCDLHGHSMKKNVFVYGCHSNRKPFEGKEFPFLVSKLFKGFSFKNCCFITPEIKQGSARSVLSKELQISNVFTLQSSFCGPQYDNIHFSVQHFQQLGDKFCQALLIYFQPYIQQKYLQGAINNKIPFQDDHGQNRCIYQRNKYFEQLYVNKSCLYERVNSENSQGSQPQFQSQNTIQDKILKKFLLMSTRSLSQRKKYHDPESMKQKIRFVIHKSLKQRDNLKSELKQKQKEKEKYVKQPKELDLQLERLEKKYQTTIVTNLKKRKQQNKLKVQTFKKIQQKPIEINDIFERDTPQIPIKPIKKSNYQSEKFIKKKKNIQEQMFFNKVLKVNSKFDFLAQNQPSQNFNNNKINIFKNNFLTNIPVSSKQQITSKDIQRQIQGLKLEIRGNQKPSSSSSSSVIQRRQSQFRIRKNEAILPEKLKMNNLIENMIGFKKANEKGEKDFFKNVLDSLKKTK